MVTPEGSVHFRPEVGKRAVAKLKKLIPFNCVVLASQHTPESYGVVHKFLCRDNKCEIVSEVSLGPGHPRESVRYTTNVHQAQQPLKGATLLCHRHMEVTPWPLELQAPITLVLATRAHFIRDVSCVKTLEILS